MRSCWSVPWIFLATSLPFSLASPVVDKSTRHVTTDADGLKHTTFYYPPTDSKLDYKTNSGVCETTPGVGQHSGYATVGEDMHMFFWLFEARHNPETAPLVLYLDGGPGAPDEGLIFSSGGPCIFKGNDKEPSLNPNSFNEFANVLFIDQPIATGFSYGANPINSTEVATEYIWKFLQAFFTEFEEYQGRDFGIIGVSYGGHTCPSLGREIVERNAAIENGYAGGARINFTSLGLINAWVDPLIQFRANINFAHNNTYRPLIHRLHPMLLHDLDNTIEPAMQSCQETHNVDTCKQAYGLMFIADKMVYASAIETYPDFAHSSVYDIRPGGARSGMDENSSKAFKAYVNDKDVQRRINANHTWRALGGHEEILDTGDSVLSFAPEFGNFLDNDIKVTVIAGNADYVCSWRGNKAVAEDLQWSGQSKFVKEPLSPFLVNGKKKGEYKSVKNLKMVTVFDSGHDVAFYQPETAQQIFRQMFTSDLTST